MKSRISIIAALDENRGLGKDNDLLFKIKEDMQRLRRITSGHPLVMGRKTFASFPGLLPNRTHIVITRDPESLKSADVQPHVIVTSLEEGIDAAKKIEEQRLSSSGLTRGFSSSMELDSRLRGNDREEGGNDDVGEIFIFGGGQIFTEAIEKDLVDRLYLTIVQGDFGADTFFPEYTKFTKVIEREEKDSEGFRYTFLTLEK